MYYVSRTDSNNSVDTVGMRRNEILSGVEEVMEALEKSNLYRSLYEYEKSLRQARRISVSESNPKRKSTDDRSEVLTALNRYSIASNSFSPAAKLVETILNLDSLADPAKWEELLSPSPLIRHFLDSIKFTRSQLPKILRLLEREYSLQSVDSNVPDRNRFISVILPEAKGQASKPQRVIELIDAVSKLYEVCVLITKDKSQEELVIVSCDSGSDKSFDFMGAAKAMESLSNLILSIYDRVAYHREERFARRIELVKEALPVYQSIEQLVQSNSIEPEAAELFKRKLTDGVSQFVESGAIFPEMNLRATAVTQRLVMAPEPKLLRSAPEISEHHSETEDNMLRQEQSSTTIGNENNVENLSKDEQQQLQQLLNKMQSGNSDFDDELLDTE